MLYGAGKTYAIGTNTTFTDSSANAFTVTRNGDTIQATANPFTGSVVFDGTSDYLSLANNAAFDFGTGNFTVECWVNINSVSYVNGGGARGASVFSSASGFSGNGWNLEIGGNSSGVPNVINFNSRQGASQVTVSASVTMANGTWYHIAVVRSGTLTSIYLNGVSVGSGTLSNQTITSVAALWVGGQDITNYQHWFNGYISNARIVKGTAVYTANFTPPTSPLTAITNTSLLLLAGQQAPFRDSSSNAFTVTANGNAAGSGVEPPSFVPYAGSGYFDGTGDYLSCASNAAFAFGSGDFTVEYWLYASSWSLAPTIIDTRITGNSVNGYSDFITSGGVFSLFLGNTTVYTMTGSLPLNTWTHIAVSRSGTSLRVFINGSQNGSTVTNSTVMSDTNLLVAINRGLTAGTIGPSFFNGYLSNVRLVKGTAVYTANFTPSAAPLTAITNTSLLLLTNNVGPFIDSSTNGFPVLRNGDTIQSGFNPFSQASAGSGYFDGTGDYLTVTNASALQLNNTTAFTIECWVYPTSLPSPAFIVENYDQVSPYPGYSLAYNVLGSGVLNFWDGGGFWINTGITLSLNQWTHIAVTYEGSGSTRRFFKNGVQSGSAGTVPSAINYTAGSCSIGAQEAGTTPWLGYISNLRIVKGTAVYTSNFTPPTSPLTAITNTSLLLLTDNYSIVNSTPTNLPVTINGNTTISTAQYPTGMSSSIYFDGNGDFLSIANNTAIDLSSGSWTIECWVYWTGTNVNADFLNKDGVFAASYPSYALSINSSTPRLSIGSGNGTSSVQILASSLGTLPTNTWVHLAGVRSGSTIYLFQNGQLAASATVTATITNGSKALIVGYQTGQPTSSYMDGYISNARIVKGAALYTANFTPPSLPMSTTVTVPAFVTNAIYGVNQIP
jgi:hypothetical protein